MNHKKHRSFGIRPWLMLREDPEGALIALAVVVALGLGVLLLLVLYDSGDNTLEEVRRRGALYVGIEGDNPPFALLEGDAIAGLDADLARALAGAVGVEVHFVVMGYDSLYDALDVGRVDVLVSALWVDPDRVGAFRYTTPYFDAGQVMVVKAGSTLSGPADLEGRTVAVEFGSEGDVWARGQQHRLHELNIRPYDAPVAALDALADGLVDAAIVDAISFRLYAREDADLTAMAMVSEEPYAAVVRVESGRLLDALNAALAEMAEDGRLAALTEAWF